METYTSKETTLRDYIRVIFRYKIVFFILPLAIIIPVYIFLELKTPTYQSSVKMYVGALKEIETDYYKELIDQSVVHNHAEFVKSNIVIERVVKALRLYEVPIDYELRFASRVKARLIKRNVEKFKQNLAKMPEEQRQAFLFQIALNRLKGSVSALPVKGLSFFEITVRDFNPAAAVVIANSVSRSYVIYDLEQQISELKLQYGEKYSTVQKLEDYKNINELTPEEEPVAEQPEEQNPADDLNLDDLEVAQEVEKTARNTLTSHYKQVYNQTPFVVYKLNKN